MLGIIIGIASIITIVTAIKGANDLIKRNLVGSGKNTVDVKLMAGENEFTFDSADELPAGLGPLPDGAVERLLKVSPLVNEGAFAIMNTMSHFTARGEWVYYVLTMAQDYELWAVGTDGQQNHRICSICPPDCEIEDVFLSGSDDGIYVRFSDLSEGSWSLVRVLP